jgi:hypothetical protein
MDNMHITAAQYIVDTLSGTTSGISATINGQDMSVPLDPDNRHYAEIMQQVEDGTLVIQEAV